MLSQHVNSYDRATLLGLEQRRGVVDLHRTGRGERERASVQHGTHPSIPEQRRN